MRCLLRRGAERRIEKIERKILEHQHIAEREWLLEKVNQLKK